MVLVQAVWALVQQELDSAREWDLALGLVLVQVVPAPGQVVLVLALVVLALALEELVMGQAMDQVEELGLVVLVQAMDQVEELGLVVLAMDPGVLVLAMDQVEELGLVVLAMDPVVLVQAMDLEVMLVPKPANMVCLEVPWVQEDLVVELGLLLGSE
ncbi:hypothetical protein PFLUV_G00190610 [Perca fluviatilis]|uniref:Uncharacterized protein n=1 Tax=Perca fluviatilis TaxID=8168 RepID=A0A6A5ER28_PERFL|nr:hypothetical protein PFLUV_G00190610 [Perca fluviatilis]